MKSIRDRRTEKLANNVSEYTEQALETIRKMQETAQTPEELKDIDELSEEQMQMLSPEAFSRVAFDKAQAEKGGYSDYSYWGSTLRMFFRQKFPVFLLCLLVLIVAFTFVQPYIPGQRDANRINDNEITGVPDSNVPPSGKYWLGTNAIGQDLWSRIWFGARTSLYIGFVVAFADAVIGIVMGLLWGYVRKLDFLFTELYNVLSNVPQTIILILISYIMRPGMNTMIVAMAATGWLALARFIRNQVVIIRDRDYNLASRCLGTPTRRIILKNLLPHMVSVIMLRMALSIPMAIGNEVFLTYVGLGLPITIPSLGNLINEGRKIVTVPSLHFQLIAPAAVLSIVTISFYLIGNAFSDAADPRNHV